MANSERTVLVFGATGQQGGSVANALLAQGWLVRALVRNTGSDKAKALAAKGVELMRGDFDDRSSVRAAMIGVYAVFSVQPSSGQGAAHNVSDEDEVRYGSTVADIAADRGIEHFVYSSANAAGSTPSGMGHFDSKAAIEARIGGLGLRSTIIRPSAFMEILMLPGQGLDQGMFFSVLRPGQKMQFIAVEDIGRIVAGILAEPDRFASRTLEIAGDEVTSDDLQARLSQAAGRPISYVRIPDDVLEGDPLLGKLAALVDDGRLAGNADIIELRQSFPGLLTLEQWLSSTGRPLLQTALQTEGVTLELR